MVERASLLLTGTAGAGETSEAQVAQVTAKAISSLAVLESFFNTGQGKPLSFHTTRCDLLNYRTQTTASAITCADSTRFFRS